MMQQYNEIKSHYTDTILFFRLGDFYEMFNDDAKKASEILGITLTTRNKNSQNPTPLCGIPYHSAEQYLKKLVKHGLKVAICEQTEDPSQSKGLVKREVTNVITPGIISDPEFLEGNDNNFLLTIGIDESDQFILSYVDITTSQLNLCWVNNSKELIDEICRISPKEVVPMENVPSNIVDGLEKDSNLKHILFSQNKSFDTLSLEEKTKLIKVQFGEKILKYDSNVCLLIGFTLHYLISNQKSVLNHLKEINEHRVSNYLEMDEASRRNLEIIHNNSTMEKRGSLLSILDQTSTPMGGRLLKQWILYPLKSAKLIQERHEVVNEFYSFPPIQNELLKLLKQIADLERLNAKISLKTANPRDLIRLKDSLLLIPEIKQLLNNLSHPSLSQILNQLTPLNPAKELLEKAIVDDPMIGFNHGEYIRENYHPELDKLRKLKKDAKEIIARLEQKERENTGIPTLKIRFNNVFGYYIEVSKNKSHLAPSHYIRKQTLTNAERFFTPELKEIEEQVLSAEDKIQNLETELFQKVISSLQNYSDQLIENSSILATIDVYHNFASIAAKWGYVKPEMNQKGNIEIIEGRHPVIEQILKDSQDETFVPNDVYIDQQKERILLITGPNMAGKSTIMRQVALISLLSQIGSFVPAKNADLCVVDKIFTRVGASDNLTQGHSTFMVEMLETANILKSATQDSLILLDEIGRGTSTFDGVSIAWAVLENLHNNIRAKTLFATHYHELTSLTKQLTTTHNYQVLVEEKQGKIKFLRKLTKGAVKKSYGIQVAKLAGIPDSVIQRAFKVLTDLEKQNSLGINQNDTINQSPSITFFIFNINIFKSILIYCPYTFFICIFNCYKQMIYVIWYRQMIWLFTHRSPNFYPNPILSYHQVV